MKNSIKRGNTAQCVANSTHGKGGVKQQYKPKGKKAQRYEQKALFEIFREFHRRILFFDSGYSIPIIELTHVLVNEEALCVRKVSGEQPTARLKMRRN